MYYFIFAFYLLFNATLSAESLEKILEKIKLDSDSTIHFLDLNTQKTLFEYQAKKPLVPASVTKLITSAFILDKLGPDHKIPTNFYSNQSWNSAGILNGSLYIKGYGDPFFVTEDMYLVTQELRLLGLKKIQGDIVLDNSFFEKNVMEIPGMGSAENRAYSALVSPLSFNFNTFTLRAGLKNKKCEYEFDPFDTSYIQIKSIDLSNNKPRGSYLKTEGGLEQFQVRGCNGTGYISVDNLSLYFGQSLIRFLKLQGIEVSGKVLLGNVPKNSNLLLEHSSRKISELLESLNSYSNNFMTEMLLLYTAGKTLNKPIGFSDASKLLQSFADSITPGQTKLENGSGLSADNKIPCQFLTTLLTKVQSKPLNFSALYLSLARPSKDGTLDSRPELANLEISAKTGSFTNPMSASSLAGYVKSKKGTNIAFCMINNNFKSLPRSILLKDQFLNKIIEDF